ncbi:MAG: CBS domain-containing protein [Firmicutes bacterium]|nr:CBS domain-containing protein [Candidatus Alectryobacillus merdavium]
MDNVLFFITPKSQTTYLTSDFSIRQALEKIKYHRYTSVPIIDKFGKYVGTITEGDLLWFIIENNILDIKKLEEIKLSEVKRNRDNFAVNVSSKVSDLFSIITNQNFVPIVDDSNVFIGIITRKSVIKYLQENNTILEKQ